MNNLYVTSLEPKSGKTTVVLGMMQLLLSRVRNVAIFRPIINKYPEGEKDHDINLVLNYFGINMPYEDTFAITLPEARQMINNGQREALFNLIIQKYKALVAQYEFVVCEGTDYMANDTAFEFDLNADIAAALGTSVIIVNSGYKKTAQDIIDTSHSTLDLLDEKSLNVTACLITKANVTEDEAKEITTKIQARENNGDTLFTHIIKDDPTLEKPTMKDVQQWFGGQVLYGKEHLDALVNEPLIAAMQLGNFLNYLKENQVVITPGDRLDIVLGCLAARASNAYPDIAGVLITGGIDMPDTFKKVLQGWTVPMPILTVEQNTSQSINMLAKLSGKIEPTNIKKVSAALELFKSSVPTKELADRIIHTKSSKISPRMFEYNLIERAAAEKMRIVLPEGGEDRILHATDILTRRNVADVILLGNKTAITKRIAELGLNINSPIIDPESSPLFEDYVNAYFEYRKAKGITIDQAREVMKDPTYFGTMMVQKGDADGMVSGAINTTAHTIRPAFEFVKTKPGASTVSSVFLMCMKDKVLVFGDCAVNPNPTSQQLASIAISSAETAKVFGIEPKVAMLSYSTGTSGKGTDVDQVKEATKLAQEQAPELLLEGPIQYDAAIDAEVARTKLPDSKVAGQATVFIFPDLNTGNNTYKAVQRAAGAIAIGPVLQGLNKPVNDLSRGATIPDIINTVAITAIQAQAEKHAK